jgi:hypothetical protein
MNNSKVAIYEFFRLKHGVETITDDGFSHVQMYFNVLYKGKDIHV